jgi:hypothetical protein
MTEAVGKPREHGQVQRHCLELHWDGCLLVLWRKPLLLNGARRRLSGPTPSRNDGFRCAACWRAANVITPGHEAGQAGDGGRRQASAVCSGQAVKRDGAASGA